jgi:hypothetical protein
MNALTNHSEMKAFSFIFIYFTELSFILQIDIQKIFSIYIMFYFSKKVVYLKDLLKSMLGRHEVQYLYNILLFKIF